jgi:hypothetical protein
LSDWQLDRLPGDVRLEAENAAQREGLPLHRWLGKLIRDTCAEEGVALSRELSRGVLNSAAAPQRRPQSTIAAPPAEAEKPPRPVAEARAAEPPRPPEPSSAVVAKSNGVDRAGNGHAPAAEPVAQPEPPRAVHRSAPRMGDSAPESPNPPARRVAPGPAPDVAPPATPRFAATAPNKPAAATAAPAQPSRIVPEPAVVTRPKPEPPATPPTPAAPQSSRVTPQPIVFSVRPKQEPPATPPSSRPAAEPVVAASARPTQEPPAPTTASSDDREASLTKLVQGLRRNELSPIGEARLYLKLMTEHGASIAELTVATGRTRDQITRSLRLLSLSDRLRDLIDRGALSREKAYALLDSENPEATNPVVPPNVTGRPQ